MKIQTKHLLPAVETLLPLTNGRTALPILNCFKLESDGEILTITASDLDQFATQQLACDGKLEPCCVNAYQFALLAKSGTDEINVTQIEGALKITANGNATLKTLPAEEFVPTPSDKQTKQGCNCADLAGCVETVSFAAASKDENRFVLQHIFVNLEPKKMTAQATNARIVATSFKLSINGTANFLCHGNFAGMFCDYLRFENAELSIGKNYFSIKSDSGQWFGKMPEERWPVEGINAQRNANKDKVGIVSVSEMRSIVQLADSLCKDVFFRSVNLDFTKKALNFSCKTSQSEPYEKEILGAFNPVTIRMDLGILLTAFQKLKSDEVTIEHGADKIFMSDGNLDLVMATLKPE